MRTCHGLPASTVPAPRWCATAVPRPSQAQRPVHRRTASPATEAAPVAEHDGQSEAAAVSPRKRGRPSSKAAKPDQADLQWLAALSASMPDMLQQLQGPDAAAVAPPVPNRPADVHAMVAALQAMSSQLQASQASLLALVTPSPDSDTLHLDLALVPGVPPTPRSTQPAAPAGQQAASTSGRAPMKVTSGSSVPVLAAMLASLLVKAAAQDSAQDGPTAACLEATGAAAVHNMLSVVCATRCAGGCASGCPKSSL